MQKSIRASRVSMALAVAMVCCLPRLSSAEGTLQPLEYLPLEYIESDGTSGPYIDTLYRPTSDTKVSIDYAYQGSSSGSNWIPLWGYRRAGGSDQFALFTNRDGNQLALNFKTMDVQAGSGIARGDRCVVSNDNTRLYVATPGAAPRCIIDQSDLEFSALDGWTLAIFGFRTGLSTVDNRLIRVRIYGFTIREGNTLVRDYIPAQRASDGAVGLYDRQNGTFSGNAGASGTIGAGPQLAVDGLQIAGNPKEFFPVTPTYGYYLCEAGETYTATASSSGMDSANISSAGCAGWNLYRVGESSPFRTSADAGETPLSCTLTYAWPVRLEWVWDNSDYTLETAPVGNDYGSVTCVPANTGAYAPGTVVTATATANSGYAFLGWTGDVPGGFTTNATITVTMDADKSCRPIYAGPWLYNGSNQITDGNWVLTVSRTAGTNELSVTAVASVGNAAALPLGTRVEDAGGAPFEIVSVTGFRDRTDLRLLTLPANLRTVGGEAFLECTSLRSVTPLLPDTVTSIGNKAFYNAPVEGTLRIGYGGNLTLRTGDYYYGLNFSSSGITALDAGTGLTTIPARCFMSCASLTNVVFAQAGLTYVGDNCFQDCTSLRTVAPFLPDTVTTIGYRAFYNAPVEGTLRIGYGGNLTIRTGDYYYGQNFSSTGITALDTGPGLVSIPTRFMNDNASLTNVDLTLSSQLASVGGEAFRNNGALATVHVSAYPTFGSSVFANTAGSNMRVYLSRFSSDWNNWLADTAHATPWASLSESDKEAYDATFGGRRPFGRAAADNSPFPKNAWLLALDGVQVSGRPQEFFPVTPTYGYYTCEAGETRTFTAASSGMDAGNTASSDCVGWNLYRAGESSPFRTSADDSETRLSCTLTYTEPVRLEWVWGSFGYVLDTTPVGNDYGSVTFVPANTGTYEPDTVVTATAAANSGYAFIGWAGDVPDGFTTNATITVTMDADKACHPIYAGPWLYNGSNQITDGNWVLTVSRTAGTNELSVTAVASVGNAAALPLGTRVEDAGGAPFEIVSVTGFRDRTDLRLLTLPANLRTVGGEAFYQCTSLRSITPLLPDSVTYIGYRAFYNNPVEGVLRLGFGPSLTLGTDDFSNGYHFYHSCIVEVVGGPALGRIASVFMSGNTSLTNVDLTLSSQLDYIGAEVFRDCTSLRTVTPFLPDTVTYLGCRAFYNAPVEGFLRLGFGPSLTFGVGDFSYGQQFNQCRVVEVVGGPALVSLPILFMNNNTSLTNVNLTLSRQLESVGDEAFRRNGAFSTVYLNAYPTFGGNVFAYTAGANMRVYLSSSVPGWDGWLADTANATPWDSLSDSVKDDYRATFGGRRPVGRAAADNSPFPRNAWLLRYSTEHGTKIILQ